ncbi:unnamed protein product, partial [Hymenolepis diminuta]
IFFRNVPNTFTATASHSSTKNRTQIFIIPLLPTMLTTAKNFEAANDGMKLHPSVRDSVKVASLNCHSYSRSSNPDILLFDHQTNQIFR